MALSTQSSLAISRQRSPALELSAAVDGQQGLYVTVSSKETPIAAVVRTVSMNGLTSKGSDFALPLHDASNASVATSIAKGDAVDAYLYAASATGVTLSWITEHGLVQAKDATLQANRVTVVDLGKAPEDALGVMSTAGTMSFSVKASQSGDDDQADFALINAAAPASFTGLAIPDDVDATVSLANSSNQSRKATLHAYDDAGLRSLEMDTDANAARTIDIRTCPATMASAVLLDARGPVSEDWLGCAIDPRRHRRWQSRRCPHRCLERSSTPLMPATEASVWMFRRQSLDQSTEQVDPRFISQSKVRVDFLGSAAVEFPPFGHQLVTNRQLQFDFGWCLRLQRHAVQHDSCRNAMPCGEALRGHIRLDLPRHRIRRRHILHSELQRAHQFRVGIAAEATHLSGHHIVEHAGTCAVAGQTGAEHRGARTVP